MKPLLLKLKGLNSFDTEEQQIDFEKLGRDGLFGIFGSTGSGKSTIIDAMSIALFGEMPRHSKNSLRQGINSGSNEMHISLKFKLGSDIYTAERSYCLKGDKFEQRVSRFYMEKDSEITVISDKASQMAKKVENILGLSYDDFLRSVVLPQGKFSEFLLLENLDRRNMLERIFGLETLGQSLTNRIRDENKDNKNKLEVVENSLAIYGDATPEKLEEYRKNYEAGTAELELLKLEREEIQKLLSGYERLNNLLSEQSNYKKQEEVLNGKAAEIQYLRVRLGHAEKADRIMPNIKEIEELNTKQVKLQAELSLLEKTIMETEAVAEKAEKTYLELAIRKDKEYPELVANKARLEQAVKIKEECQRLKEERQELVTSYKSVNGRLTERMKEKVRQDTEKNNLEEQLEEILIKRRLGEVTPEYRQIAAQAYELYKKNKKAGISISEIKNKEASIRKNLEQEKLRLFEAEEKYAALVLEISNKEKELENLKAPGSMELILKTKEEFISREKDFSIKQQLLNSLGKMEDSVKTLTKVRIDKLKEIEQKQEEFNRAEINLQTLEQEIETAKLKNMAQALASGLKEGEECPVCGSTRHVKPPHTETDISGMAEKLKKSSKKLNAANQNLQILIAEEKSSARELENLNKEYEKLAAEFKGFNLELERESLQALKEAIASMESAFKAWTEQKEGLESNIKNKTRLMNEYTIQRTELAAGISKDNELLQELEGNLNDALEEFKTDVLVMEELSGKLKTADIEEVYIQISEKDKERVLLEKKEVLIRKKQDELSILLENLKKEISLLEIELEGITVGGKEKQENILRNEKLIEELSSGREPDKYLLEITEAMGEILEKSEQSAKRLEYAKEQRSLAAERKNTLLTQINTLKDMSENADKRLKAFLTQYEFKNSDYVKSIWLSLEQREEVSGRIERYDIETKKLINIISNLEEKIINFSKSGYSILNCQDNLFNYIEKNKNNLERIEQKTQINAIMKERIEKMSDAVIAVKRLLEEKRKLIHSSDLLNDLAELFKGNRFVEFIAKRQLRYITAEASGRLKDMTNGRYALELDDTDFIVRDDYNGGVRRSPKTLSGGETFMTSLCLALALSAKIQLKNKAPLEFFFLDEGFGTLDSVLLDVVMACLERLPSEKMSVGVITHVQELKNRIPRKLHVLPPVRGICGTRLELDV